MLPYPPPLPGVSMSDTALPDWAVRLRQQRQARGWGYKRLARALGDLSGRTSRADRENMRRTVWGHEHGEHYPREWYRRLYAELYETTEDDLFRANPAAPIEAGPSAVQHSLPTLEIGTSWAWGDDMERRRLLQAAASIGLSAAVGPSDALGRLIDLDMASVVTQTVEDWEGACAIHLEALHTLPPAEVQQRLHLDLLTVQRQVSETVARYGRAHIDSRGLYRVLACLSTLQANVLTRVGAAAPAREWWQRAERAADASEDVEVRLGVRATAAGHALAAGLRDPASVLIAINSAERIAERDAPGSFSRGLVGIAKAKALSLLGCHPEAVAALDGARVLIEPGTAAVSVMPGYWKQGQLSYAEVWVHAGAGRENQAMTAGELVAARNPDYQYRTNVQLHAARCAVARGGVVEGLRSAAEVLDGVGPAYQTHMMRHTGLMVLRAVPADKRDLPAVREVRAMLSPPGEKSIP